MMPVNIAISSPIIQVRVLRALRHSTGLNAGTALEIASMPVIAVEPDAKARSTSNRVTAWEAWSAGGGSARKPRPPASKRPTIISSAIATMNA